MPEIAAGIRISGAQATQTMTELAPESNAPATKGLQHPMNAGMLAREVATVTPEATCNEVIKIFNAEPSLTSLVVVDGQKKVLGVLRSLDILRRGTEGYFQELLGRRSCTRLMDPNPLVFDAGTPLLEMSAVVSKLDDRHLLDGFFVTQAGIYQGTGRMTELIRAVTELQVSLARYANPLTLLPGNVPIDQQIDLRLHKGTRFVVGYFDLDNFKGFNDVYGYHAGDGVIRLAAQVLAGVTEAKHDFLGHIGGDDFVLLLESADWEERIRTALAHFDKQVLGHFRPEHIAAGGLFTTNRQGVEVFHPLVSLSAGLLRVEPGNFDSPAEISDRLAEAKKLAKQTAGSSYFVDRRSGAPASLFTPPGG